MGVFEKIKSHTQFPVKKDWLKIKTIDMHTGGEPLRVILDGYPPLEGNSVLEYRNYVKQNLDHLRKALMFEPRGHADMYGCLLVPPNDETGDFGIIFMHNEGYSTMCGHAIIAISTLAAEMNWIDKLEGENKIEIDAPCGRITSFVDIQNGEVQGVKFHCVPSFVVGLDREIDIKKYGKVTYDLAYGGAFYAYVDMDKNNFDFDLTDQSYRQLISVGMDIKRAVMDNSQDILHPYESDLSFLYGTIFIGKPMNEKIDSRNVCIFAEGEVDRCPTGSGVSGRMAIHHKRKELPIGKTMAIESIIDSVFIGSIVREENYGGLDSVIPQVEGTAHVVGEMEFLLDPKDLIGQGFILR